jgi:hypothetical protein
LLLWEGQLFDLGGIRGTVQGLASNRQRLNENPAQVSTWPALPGPTGPQQKESGPSQPEAQAWAAPKVAGGSFCELALVSQWGDYLYLERR